MATHSSVLAWKIPWTEEPADYSPWSHRVRHDWAHTHVFIAAIFTIVKIWKLPKCPSVDEWIKNIYGIYKMEYNLTIIMNEILSFTKTWVNLEGIMLSEINQTEKDIYHMISSYRWNISKINEKKKTEM